MKKQLPWLLLILLIAVCISGCGKPAAQTETQDTPPASGDTVLTDAAPEADISEAIALPASDEVRTHDEYFSETRSEAIDWDSVLWAEYSLRTDENGTAYLAYDKMVDGKMTTDTVALGIENVVPNAFARTQRSVWCVTDDGHALKQANLETGTVTEAYRTESTISAPTCGANIVLIPEQMTDGTWRVLRLYEPDGTIDVIEADLPQIRYLQIVSNCEFLIVWDNPEYADAEAANIEAIWAEKLPDAGPYPGREEADRISDFHDHLAEWIFAETGVPQCYSRYVNKLNKKTVTLATVFGGATWPYYYDSDGELWSLSWERMLYEFEHYGDIRFWLYLPDDDAEKNMQAAAEAEKAATMADSGYTSITLSLPSANSTAFTSSPLLETLTPMVPVAEGKTHDEYFSAIRFEDTRRLNDVNGAWPGFSFGMDEDGQLYLDYMYEIFEKNGGREYSRFKHETLEYPFVGARGNPDNDNCGNTMRKAYFLSTDEKALMQIDPITAEAAAVYEADCTLAPLVSYQNFGCNIVVFSEQNSDGTWRVLRLYEPDGTVDVVEDKIPARPSVSIVSNCEFVIGWKNPEYTKAAEAYGESLWNEINWGEHSETDYPTTEEEKWLPENEIFFSEVLPHEIYFGYGILPRFVRYRNTRSGKTVTLGTGLGGCAWPYYYRLDGTLWSLSNERMLYESETYNMVRFWLYLPADQ